MDMQEKIQQAKENIWQAIRDYRAHTSKTDTLDDISETFVNRLAEDSIYAKQELRELFRKSPVWNEKLDALVINGTRTHNPDYDRIESLATDLLAPAREMASEEAAHQLDQAVRFFSAPEEDIEKSIEAIRSLAPDAYVPGKKPSRVFKALCDALGVSDKKAGSPFQRQYAQFADELSSKKIPFKLFVSLNPAHFLTMSNPKRDDRGDMLTSCHSLNSTQYPYNCGCIGYARDSFTFIVFVAADPENPETLNNRKTARQIFAYKPGNGLLLQSRLYNTYGGTYGAQEDSNLYRDLVQREISSLEDAANLWKTYDYFNNSLGCNIYAGEGFGGYQDWTYKDFAAKISLRNDHEEDFMPFEIGTSSLCIVCGEENNSHLYCSECYPSDDDEDDDWDEDDEDDDDEDDWDEDEDDNDDWDEDEEDVA